ncbi:MAG: ATP-binding protein [Bacteroidota bacterium]
MNKKAIWIIIGLMSAALIGIVFVQGYWIRWSIKLNEEQFDKSVLSSLNWVSAQLEKFEEVEEGLELWGPADEEDRKNLLLELEFSHHANNYDLFQSGVNTLDSFLFNFKQKTQFGFNNDCECADCRKERNEHYKVIEAKLQRQSFKKLLNPDPLADRIKLKNLHNFIKVSLANRGIYIDCDYGVYSRRDKSFVIINGHYVVKDAGPHSIPEGSSNIYNSKYKVDLFASEVTSPGLLLIHFPAKASVVWKGVWKNLLASILFTCIILFCFAYTVQVIFLQKKLSEMKTDFINNMTHEFKTPIATISLAADSITSPMILNNVAKVRRFADIIKQENKRMNSQVEKVLQMAVIDKRDFQLKLTQLNLHDLVRQAVANASLQVEKKGGTVDAVLDAKNPHIEGDLTHVSNMIHNLLDNANKYSPEEPQISVHTRNVANGVEVTVKDEGIGMSKEARKHIFDKFYRVHTGNLHDVKGFGLGLSYVKAMITAHKGQIDVKSELGKGSSFILVFPNQVHVD